uniref:TEF transcription factor, PAR bZIP family member a n=1 Tax=Poecilia reticulata TaxID=8081 RepID=A0A3P9Q8X3_POERE
MSVEPIHIKLEAAGEPPSSFPVVLKKIMEMPPPNILDEDDGSADLTGGGSDMGPSAALTPAIWDKTIPYDGESFHLEYMDLEEFLMENGIPTSPDNAALKGLPEVSVAETEKVKTAYLSILSSNREVVSPVTISQERATPEPIDPDEIEVNVNYEPDPTDLVLSSVPGGELFNPRKHKFSEEELKPQPMIKKAKKVFVPEEQKDEKYWQRRKKNNMAAKRSRDARRLKENQITVRAAFLERENMALRQEVAELRKECGQYKNVVGRYESKYGPM